jgi:hypothetical protein
MAFKGGFFIRPVETDFDGLVGLYASGKAKTEQSRNLRRQERSKQLADLTEKSDFVHTGIEDIDIGHLQAGQLAAQALQDAQMENMGGKMSLGAVSAEFSNQMSQVQVLGKRLELFKNNYDETEKRVADGEASVAEKNSLIAGWYPQKGIPGMINLPDGTQRPAEKQFYFSNVIDRNGLRKLVVNVEQEYLDEKGQLQIYSGRRGLTESVSPNRELINQVSVQDRVQTILGGFGKRETYVNENGLVIPSPVYPYSQRLNSGSDVYYRGIAPETFGDVRNTVETNIAATPYLEYVSMLADLGALAPTDLGFEGYKDIESRQNQFSGLYDKEGNPLTFKKDPLVMERDANMRYTINEDNKKLIDAMLRDNTFKGMDVTVKEIRDGKLASRNGSGSTTNYAMSSLPISTITNGVSTESSVDGNTNSAGYYRDLITAEFILDNAIEGNVNANQIADVNQFLRFGYNTDISKTLFANNPNVTGLSTAQAYVSDLSDDMTQTKIVGASLNNFKKLYPQAKLTSVAGYEISEVSGMIGIETPSGFQVHFTGTADVADMKRQQSSGGGNTGNTQTANLVGLTVAKIPVVSKPLSNSELTSRWTERYKQDPDFANRANRIAESYNLKSGEDPVSTTLGTAQIGPKNWWYDILQTY